MKTFPFLLVIISVGLAPVLIHSQSRPPVATSGAGLLQIKAANENLIARQKATLEILKAMEADSDQMRIIAKRK